MINTLLFIHLVIAILLVVVILLQKTSTDGLSGIGGGGNNMGIMSGRSAATFLTRTTVILATLFFVNALILGNLSSQSHSSVINKTTELETVPTHEDKQEEESLPVAK